MSLYTKPIMCLNQVLKAESSRTDDDDDAFIVMA